MSNIIQILSLGGGVQSSTMALMAAKGEIKPMPSAAIFADTQDEPKAVYEWIEWLKKQLPFPVHVVTKGRLSEKSTTVRTSKKTGLTYTKPQLPVFTKYQDREKGGMMPRHCSPDMKISPIHSFSKKLAGRGNKIITWIGISTDEPDRMKDSRDDRIIHRYPLIEQNISRLQCLEWMRLNNFPKPPRSACIYCPYHSDDEWIRIRSESEDEWQFAVAFEKRLQSAISKCPRLESVPFLHSSRVPLDEVKFNPNGGNSFRNQSPCQGICGV